MTLALAVLLAVSAGATDVPREEVAWPGVSVSWKGAEATLRVQAPDGEHVAEEAPFDLSLSIDDRILVVEGMGVDLAPGIRVGDVRGLALSGVVSLSLCEDGGVRCRLVEISVQGQVEDRRRGRVVLEVSAHAPPELDEGPPPDDEASPRRVDALSAYASGRARARQAGVPLLVSFGALWCPPCQRMDTEVFLASPRPAVLGAVERAWIDVDDPSSWELKDRYDVSEYPTLVAIEPDSEAPIGRLVGYPGRDAVVAWIDGLVTKAAGADASDPGPRVAAKQAWRAVREGRIADAAALLDVAKLAPEEVPFRLARFHVDPTIEDARWLMARVPRQAMSWVGALRGTLRDDPEARAVVRQAIHKALPSALPEDAADLLTEAASLSDDPQTAKLLYAAAARLVESTLTGDPSRDRGRVLWLAGLEEQAGYPGAALGRLEAARSTLSEEPTFHVAAARLMVELGLGAEAIPVAQTALDTAWGDNRLRAAEVLAEALLSVGQREEARAMVERVLRDLPAPEEALEVRTHRMRAALRELVQ